MEQVVSTLSSYLVLNYLLPGVMLVVELEYLFNTKLSSGDLVKDLALYYFIGIIISRIGSLFVEKVLIHFKFVKFAKYSSYIDAELADPKIKDLVESNNMYRSLLTVQFLVLVLYFSNFIIDKMGYRVDFARCKLLLIVITLVLFAFSYKKLTKSIFDRVINYRNKKL